jgi:hypothetical protein
MLVGFSSRGSKAWALSSHWDTTWAKIWLGLSLVLVARSFMAFLYLMLVSLYTKQQRWFQAVLPGVYVYQTCYQEDQSVVEVC